jgi:hypothetical protein
VSVVLAGLMAIALCSVSMDVAVAAGGAIEGTIKATGLASNGDGGSDIEQLAGLFAAPSAETTSGRCSSPAAADRCRCDGPLERDPTRTMSFARLESHNLRHTQAQTKDHAFAKCAKPPCAYVQLCAFIRDAAWYRRPELSMR